MLFRAFRLLEKQVAVLTKRSNTAGGVQGLNAMTVSGTYTKAELDAHLASIRTAVNSLIQAQTN